jgi:hypothetical protein
MLKFCSCFKGNNDDQKKTKKKLSIKSNGKKIDGGLGIFLLGMFCFLSLV